jgi:hypothetical protein
MNIRERNDIWENLGIDGNTGVTSRPYNGFTAQNRCGDKREQKYVLVQQD